MESFTIPKIKDTLDIVMKCYPENISDQTSIEIETLLDHCLDGIEDESDKMLGTLFIKALKKHIGPIGIDEHIYLQKFEIPQIKLFDLIIKHFPFVTLGHTIVNNTIVKKISNYNFVTLIDIGIGRGIQVINLIKELNNTENSHLEKLTIIGIEPFQDALDKTHELIVNKSLESKFWIDFIPLNGFVENYNFDELKRHIPLFNQFLVINESLTLHHVQSSEKRNQIFRDLAKYKPNQFMLTEPNVDHFERDFHKRFENSYKHFSHVFKVIDNLEINKQEKNALKLFFGREIEDIFGKKFEERYERHEPAEMWIYRLKNTGYEITNHFELPESIESKDIKIDFNDKGFLGFTHEDETILAIIHAYIP